MLYNERAATGTEYEAVDCSGLRKSADPIHQNSHPWDENFLHEM